VIRVTISAISHWFGNSRGKGPMTKPQKPTDDPFARERRLRRLATKRGFTLVRPWAGERRKVGGGFSSYVLVPHHSGLSLDEVEEILTRDARQHN
jgi:hypothetical protein